MMERKESICIFNQILDCSLRMFMVNKNKNNSGLTLMEILIGVLITSIMMAAMYTSYNVVNQTYSKVSDKAKISRSSRDITSMIMSDLRMAGFKYYAGSFARENFSERISEACRNEGLMLPNKSYLAFYNGYERGETVGDFRADSHNPVVIRRTLVGGDYSGGANPAKNNVEDICCDHLQIVYDDFSLSSDDDLLQPFKRFRISYFAEAIDEDGDVRYGVFKSIERWRQRRGEDLTKDFPDQSDDQAEVNICKWPTEGEWELELEKELIRDHIEDMEFIPFDRFGKIIADASGSYPTPENSNTRKKLFDIRGVDIKLTFRSKEKFFKEKKKRVILGLNDRNTPGYIEDEYLRDSVIVSVHTRNIGGGF